jgi:hypothetical protein
MAPTGAPSRSRFCSEARDLVGGCAYTGYVLSRLPSSCPAGRHVLQNEIVGSRG